MSKLPKTRSGKILRGTMRKILNGQIYNFPATIDDATTLDLIKQLATEFKAKKAPQPKAEEEKVPEPSPEKSVPSALEGPKEAVSVETKEAEVLTAEQKRALKKERDLKRKKAAMANFEPRVLRSRKGKEEPKKVGDKRPNEPEGEANAGEKIQKQ